MPTLLDSRRPERSGLGRYLAAARRALARRRYRGTRIQCPCCLRRLRDYAPDWNRPGVICPGCGSHQRHRALCLYLDQRTDLGTRKQSLLHFAPEFCLRSRIAGFAELDYVTADLDPQPGDIAVDITAMQFEDSSFDAVICSHVLEHVEDDRRAMQELLRVLRPGGWCLIFVPLAPERPATYEDPAVVTPEQRLEAYGQDDHVRVYAMDIADRLRATGFLARTEHLDKLFELPVLERYGLTDEIFFHCERPAGA